MTAGVRIAPGIFRVDFARLGDEVERIEGYHHDEPQDNCRSPLFGRRGPFAEVD